MTQVLPLDLIRLVCPALLEGDRDSSVIEQRLDKLGCRGWQHEGSKRPSAGVDLPPGYAVSVRHEIAIAGGREAQAGSLLEKADNLRRNHDFGCSRRLHRILSDAVRSTASASAAIILPRRERKRRIVRRGSGAISTIPSTQEPLSAVTEAKRLSQVVLGSLEEDASADQLARRAYRSRAQFFRVFGAMIDEQPAAMPRRVLLERPPWQLGRTHQSITEIAFDAHYGSLEAFTRAFCRAFKISPSLYRRVGAPPHHPHAAQQRDFV